MITDSETNFVYFSSILRDRYRPEFEAITSIIDKWKKKGMDIDWDLLHRTKDIWCRDYCPIQIDETNFVQFRYDPSYLRGSWRIRTNPSNIKYGSNSWKFKTIPSKINLDGGNVVKWQDKVIVTDRVFSENCKKCDDSDFIDELRVELGVKEIMVIPAEKEDFTGHADGMARFIDGNTVFVSKYVKDDETRFNNVKRKLGNLNPIEFPSVLDASKYENPDTQSAIGCYLNLLQVGNLIIVPQFGYSQDKDALDTMRKYFREPKYKIETVNINRIGEQGGLMNCISWNIKK